jgi:hypothetical protein
MEGAPGQLKKGEVIGGGRSGSHLAGPPGGRGACRRNSRG